MFMSKNCIYLIPLKKNKNQLIYYQTTHVQSVPIKIIKSVTELRYIIYEDNKMRRNWWLENIIKHF